MNRETAQWLSLAAQLIGLLWIPGVAWAAGVRGASMFICCACSWAVGVVWGFGFCLILAAWSFQISPGWELFPDGPGAMLFLVFGWMGGFPGLSFARFMIETERTNPGRLKRYFTWAKIFALLSLPAMIGCLVGVYLIGQSALKKVMDVEFPTKESGTIRKWVTDRHADYRGHEVILSHQAQSKSPPTELGRLRERKRELGRRPDIWESGGLLAVRWKELDHDVLAVRSLSGRWQAFRFEKELFDQWPGWRQGKHAPFVNRPGYSKITEVDLENRVVKFDFHTPIAMPVILRLSADGSTLTLDRVEWPGGAPSKTGNAQPLGSCSKEKKGCAENGKGMGAKEWGQGKENPKAVLIFHSLAPNSSAKKFR
jgi:hypothetical protein